MSSEEVLRNARFNPTAASPGAASTSIMASRYDEAPTAASIFGASIDPAALHPLAGLVDNKDLDYLSLEDDKLSSTAGGKSVLPSRGWGDELCYGTGTTYLAGMLSSSVSPFLRFVVPRQSPGRICPHAGKIIRVWNAPSGTLSGSLGG